MQVQALSSDGRCKAFAADADGYGRGEGFASVVIEAYGASSPSEGGRSRRRHGAAVAVLAGSAVNQDGRSSGLTAPHGPSQVRITPLPSPPLYSSSPLAPLKARVRWDTPSPPACAHEL